MVNVLGAVAQWELEATAERTSAALQVLKQQGRATGGVAPYAVSSSSTGAGHGTRTSRKRLQPSSSTAPPASGAGFRRRYPEYYESVSQSRR